jgi:hypothetical protein
VEPADSLERERLADVYLIGREEDLAAVELPNSPAIGVRAVRVEDDCAGSIHVVIKPGLRDLAGLELLLELQPALFDVGCRVVLHATPPTWARWSRV